jgi:hypothetical protein
MELNKWILELEPWCPAQIFYYFNDANGGHWVIYLRWDGHLGNEPWSAWLVPCDADWDFIWDSPESVDLLKEQHHTPGTVTGYYYDKEYPFLMERVLKIVREMKPELKDIII